MPAFLDLAVRGLQSVVQTGIVTKLREVEQEDNLPADSLKDPQKVIRAALPNTHLGANRPVVLVYDEQGNPDSQRQNIVAVQCSVEMLWTAGTDFEEAEDFGRQWMTALYRTVAYAESLPTGITSLLVQDFDRVSLLYDSSTRHGRRLGVEVRVHNPRRRP